MSIEGHIIVAPAIEKDVLMTSNIYKPSLMSQLFEVGCSYSGELLSLTKMLGQLLDAGNVTTLSSYLEILKQANLLCGLQNHLKNSSVWTSCNYLNKSLWFA